MTATPKVTPQKLTFFFYEGVVVAKAPCNRIMFTMASSGTSLILMNVRHKIAVYVYEKKTLRVHRNDCCCLF